MKKAYSLTISRAKLDKKPTKYDIHCIRDQFYQDHSAHETKWAVSCFELKKNGWLHYHAAIIAPYITWKNVLYPGWHFKLDMLKTPEDIINWCGYVQKFKIDKVDIHITIKKVQKFKKDKARIKIIPHIADFTKWLKSESDSE